MMSVLEQVGKKLIKYIVGKIIFENNKWVFIYKQPQYKYAIITRRQGQ